MSRRLNRTRYTAHCHQKRQPLPVVSFSHLWKRWFAPSAISVVVVALTVILLAMHVATPDALPSADANGATVSPQVHAIIDLKNFNLHPRQLVYDQKREGIWFWTSTQDGGANFDNRLYRFDIATKQLHSWPLYSGDWSSQLLAGMALAPDGTIWIGWNHNLVVFNPQNNVSTRFALPVHPRFPLPAAVMRDLPSDLGIADLTVARDGTIWIARYGALSLTAFSPRTATFQEYPLPETAGDPARIALGPDGHVFFTTNLSADHPGFAMERVGEFAPETRDTSVYAHGAQSLAVAPNGDLYTALSGPGFGLSRLRNSERANAQTQHRAPNFEQAATFAVDDTAVAVDSHGQIWMSVAGQPDLAVLNPQSGQVRKYQYATASAAQTGFTRPKISGAPRATPNTSGVLLAHIVAMVTDDQGDLWYVRAGSDIIEEVAP